MDLTDSPRPGAAGMLLQWRKPVVKHEVAAIGGVIGGLKEPDIALSLSANPEAPDPEKCLRSLSINKVIKLLAFFLLLHLCR